MPITSLAKLLAALLRMLGVISTFWDRSVKTFTCELLQVQSGRFVQIAINKKNRCIGLSWGLKAKTSDLVKYLKNINNSKKQSQTDFAFLEYFIISYTFTSPM